MCLCERALIYCTVNLMNKAIFRQFRKNGFFFSFFFFRHEGAWSGGSFNCNDFPPCHLAVFQGFSLWQHRAIWGSCFLISPGRLPVSLGGNSPGTGFNWGHPPWKRFPPLSREMEALNVMHIKTSSIAGQEQAGSDVPRLLLCPSLMLAFQGGSIQSRGIQELSRKRAI